VTIIICITIANTSFLTRDKLSKYAVKDRKYITAAITVTISRFGPSGSLKNANMVLEHRMAETPKIISGVLFDLKFIF